MIYAKKHSLKRPYRIRYQKPDLLGESRDRVAAVGCSVGV